MRFDYFSFILTGEEGKRKLGKLKLNHRGECAIFLLVEKAFSFPIGQSIKLSFFLLDGTKAVNPSMYLPDYSLCPLIPLNTAVKHRRPGELCSSCQYGVIHKIQIHTRYPYHHVWRQEVSFLNPFLKKIPNFSFWTNSAFSNRIHKFNSFKQK